LTLALALTACTGEGGGKASTDAGPDDATDTGDDNVLDLGEVLDLTAGGDGAYAVEVDTPGGDEEYVLQLVSLSRNPLESYIYEVRVNGEPLPEPPEETGPITHAVPYHAPPPGWNEAIAAVSADAGPARPSKDPPPEVGDLITMFINDGSAFVEITCEVMIVSDTLVVVFDRTTDPGLTIDEEILADVPSNFAGIVLPRMRAYFGEESDVNEDGHVTMLFSPLVIQGSGGATAYVTPCDLLAPDSPGCQATNEQELIYITPPDLLAPYMASALAITETLAHEFQHEVYFYRKYMLNDAMDQDESIYITEGMSAMAQDVSGFQAGNRYIAAGGIESVDDISLASVMAYPYGYDPLHDMVYRGTAYLILRYAFDQLGADAIDGEGVITDLGGIAFLNALTDTPLFGYAGFENASGLDADEVFFDFYTALLLDDREKDGEPLNDDPRFNFAEMWDDPVTGNPHGVTMHYELASGTWEVRGVSIQQGGVDGDLKPGGVEYVLIPASGAGETLTIAASGTADSQLAARLVRIY